MLSGCDGADTEEFDSISHRTKIYTVISDRSIPYPERLRTLYNMYDISPSQKTDAEWQEILSSLEYLESEDKEVFSVYSSQIDEPSEYDVYLERALAYFIYRHASGAADDVELREVLALSAFLERLYFSIIKSEHPDSLEQLVCIARTVSEEIEYSEENTEKIKLELYF